MTQIKFSTGDTLDVRAVEEIQGNVMVECEAGAFSALASLFEASTSLLWEDEEGKVHLADYKRIRYMARSYGRVQMILDKEEIA